MLSAGTLERATPEELCARWRTTPNDTGVVLFYGHTASSRWPWFSNFYLHAPVPFRIPTWCGGHGGKEVVVEFAEKALMLCKASLMADTDTFERIAAADSPLAAKKLGRQVSPWNEHLWQEHVCDIARHVIFTKFSSLPELRSQLLATGERMIAEAAPNDYVWGIGLDAWHPDAQKPHKWRGANVLGWALMEVRSVLKHAGGAAEEVRQGSGHGAHRRRSNKGRPGGSAHGDDLPFALDVEGSSAVSSEQLARAAAK